MIEGIDPYSDHDAYLAKSLRTVKQMESLINEILTASKMQSSGEMLMTTVDMSEVLDSKLSQSQDLFEIRDITVNKELASGCKFNGNSELTALAVGAFISNAVLYSVGGATIEVKLWSEGEKIITSIKNKGAHIDDEDLPHLFEPFYRSESSRNSRDGGSGLGLYLADLIITKQGGSASLTNESDGVLAEIILPSI
jgi:two-component system sensor histidine kinase VanS